MEQTTFLTSASALRRSVSRLALATALMMVTWTAGAVLLARALPSSWQTARGLLVSDLALFGLGLPCFLLVGGSLPTVRGESRPLSPKTWLMLLCVFRLVTVMGALPSTVLLGVLNGLPGVHLTDRIQTLANEPWWATVLFSVVIAPLGEEFLFRRFLCDRFRVYGNGVAVLVSATLFSLFHHNLFQFTYAFAAGAFLACVYLRTGRLRDTITLHAASNLLFGVLPSYLPNNLRALLAATQWYAVLVCLLYASVAVATAVFGLVLLIRHWPHRKTSASGLSTKTVLRCSFGNLGMVVLLFTVTMLTIRAML